MTLNRYQNRNKKPLYCPPFTPMVDLIPEAEVGEYRILHIEVEEKEVQNMQLRSVLSFSYRDYYDFQAGRYVQLQHWTPGKNGNVFHSIMMSDTPMERRTNKFVVDLAKGDVLIAGLGIGMIIWPMLQKDEVETITVIESAAPIIEMVAPHAYQWAREAGKTLRVIAADIFNWPLPKGVKWGVIYFDVWDDICGDNYEDMKRLTSRFKYRRNPGGWMGAWRKAEMREHATGHYRDDYKEGFVK